MKTYDIIIIGAGINGCALAHSLKEKRRVLVIEQESIASGGSGAAGAFINPKISKAGELKELIESAYHYSLAYYQKNFLQHTTLAPLLHIAKYADENEKVAFFKTHTTLQTKEAPAELLDVLQTQVHDFEHVLLRENAIVEAKDVCEAMLSDVDVLYEKVTALHRDSDGWIVNGYHTPKLVLCTGAYDPVIEDKSIQLRSVYGQRCEITCSNPLDVTLHQHLSISAKKKNAHVALGATHYLNENDIPDDEVIAENLVTLAKSMYDLKDIEVLEVLHGCRSGSNDYLPMLGPVVNVEESLALDESALQGNKAAQLVYEEGIYMMNGVGGYGFVLAPYLAHIMAEYLLEDKALPAYLLPQRFYYRYAKRMGLK